MVVILLLGPSEYNGDDNYDDLSKQHQSSYHIDCNNNIIISDKNYNHGANKRKPSAFHKPLPSQPPPPNFTRHVTRININDVVSQIRIGTTTNDDDDDDDDDGGDAITKEEEWIKKKKTELVTTRQIETRVKRQVVLEDGKVVEDTGPIVSTNTTEDTDKKESETTERRNLDEPDEVDGPRAIESIPVDDHLPIIDKLTPKHSTTITKRTAPRPDGLVRETKEKKVVSREEIDERLEIEDVQHYGDISDEAYVNAVNSGIENLELVISSSETQKQLVPIGPRIVHQSIKSRKTIDTEDTGLKCLAQPDGTLVTEKTQTTEHEVLIDEDLPEEDDNSTGSREKIQNKESSQHYHKQRDEQKVDYVADGKVIGTEMRYLAENSHIERDGDPEAQSDWDSLSDRVRKARRQQKTLLQQQRDRKDALTNLPIDFDKEEEIRKSETTKWLESHFGSDSSRDSREDDAIEPTRKTYFNVTIKSNTNNNNRAISPEPQKIRPVINSSYTQPKIISAPPPKARLVSERERSTERELNPPAHSNGKRFFQGVSQWSDRKDNKNFPPKSFHDELSRTLEKKHKLFKQTSLPVGKGNPKDDTTGYSKLATNTLNRATNRRHSRDDSDDSRIIKISKEDQGYMSGSRNDLRVRRESRDELDQPYTNGHIPKKDMAHLRREDSGYIKDSYEDLRYPRPIRDDLIDTEHEKKQIIQRDDSAYVSSSTYLTTPRSPKSARSPNIQTPDSGIRSPTPDNLNEIPQPVPPQRKRAMERKLKMAENSFTSIEKEPQPDYSPPHSRSTSPMPSMHSNHHQTNGHNNTTKRHFQKTRFNTEKQNGSTKNAPAPQSPAKTNKVGSAIGNSIRKLVGKIRSASAERKLKLKANKQQRTPSPQKSYTTTQNNHNKTSSTYQQYNIIDGHIGQQQQQQQQQMPPHYNHNNANSRETSICSSDRRERTIDRRGSSDVDSMAKPKQHYYLGEDPYGGSIYGKENKYAAGGMRMQQHKYLRKTDEPEIYISNRSNLSSSRQPQPISTTNSSTLGRFSKSSNRLNSNRLNHNNEEMYRSVQTLPRKLEHKPIHSSTINVSIVNSVHHPQNTGPAKPARTYKSLNRSKSFNVHGLNGTNDPSPIYMSKLTRNLNNHANHMNAANMYKSNPHLNEAGPQLKSPSIVNLVSRSTRDLTKMDYDDIRRDRLNGNISSNNMVYDKRQVFLKGLQDQAPELYKTLHGDEDIKTTNKNLYKYSERETASSLGSRSPITINKDTASIIRRGSSSTDDYNETYKFITKSDDPKNPSVTNTVQSFSKKTIPTRDGNRKETIESSEIKTVTKSRYSDDPIKLRYKSDRYEIAPQSGPVIIELRNNSRK